MSSDDERALLLRSRGYAPADVALSLFTIQLTSPHSFQLSDIEVRPVDADSELQERVDLHRAAFAPSSHTVKKHRRAVASPTYRPDLDLVAEAPDSRLAAFCIVWYDEANRFGLFEPVGCHPEYQRQGYGRAVMLDGLRRLRDLGAGWAWVNAHATDARSNAFYRAVGFEKVDEFVRWESVSSTS
jgi:ribosomal protein S18 acetylase RimI-like enzyme